MASHTTTRSWPDLSQIEATYALPDHDPVVRYLERYAFLIPILVEASEIIPRFFPKGTKVALRLIPDREAMAHEDLFGIIHTSLPPDEALDRLDQLDEAWWLATAVSARGKLTLDVEPSRQCSTGITMLTWLNHLFRNNQMTKQPSDPR